jgi:hypothetical protein
VLATFVLAENRYGNARQARHISNLGAIFAVGSIGQISEAVRRRNDKAQRLDLDAARLPRLAGHRLFTGGS